MRQVKNEEEEKIITYQQISWWDLQASEEAYQVVAKTMERTVEQQPNRGQDRAKLRESAPPRQ